MRARGDSATEILTAETMADKYGVQKGSYDTVPLPTDVDVQQARHALTVPKCALHWHPSGRHTLSVFQSGAWASAGDMHRGWATCRCAAPGPGSPATNPGVAGGACAHSSGAHQSRRCAFVTLLSVPSGTHSLPLVT